MIEIIPAIDIIDGKCVPLDMGESVAFPYLARLILRRRIY